MKHDAIYALYPNAVRIRETDNDTFVVEDINDNIIEIDTAAVETKATELQTAADDAKSQKAADQANGNQKLLDLGLTQAEATALTGYTPPVTESE